MHAAFARHAWMRARRRQRIPPRPLHPPRERGKHTAGRPLTWTRPSVAPDASLHPPSDSPPPLRADSHPPPPTTTPAAVAAAVAGQVGGVPPHAAHRHRPGLRPALPSPTPAAAAATSASAARVRRRRGELGVPAAAAAAASDEGAEGAGAGAGGAPGGAEPGLGVLDAGGLLVERDGLGGGGGGGRGGAG